MKKLTAVYIFGAGASFGALPIINEFSHALEAIKFCPDDKIPYLKPFRESLDKGYYLKINSILEQFESPDNYARWLFLSGQAYDPNKNAETIQYKKIKSLYLNILYFLTYHQREIRGHLYSEPVISGNKIPNVALKNARDNQKNKILPYFNNKKKYLQLPIHSGKKNIVIDSRYMLFLLSILKSNDSNENLKYLCNTFRFYSWNYDRSFELALNSIIKNEEKQSNDFSKLISYINGSVNMYENSYSHNIKFYWENNASVIEDLPLAHEYVYIGYSFPDYNHSQDMLFLKYCIRNDIKIVIQDIKASNICEKILGIEDIQIELKNKFIPGNPTKDFSKLELKSFFDKIFYAYPACETFYIPKIQESSNYIS